MAFKDLFSGHAKDYALFRPHYPDALFQYLASLVNSHELAWDCATGNGQAAVALAKYFTHIVATDASQQQIQQAEKKENIDYLVTVAEKAALKSHSVNLLTVAQALHWFNFDKFYPEAKRVLIPAGVLAAWSYPLCRIDPEVDAVILRFYETIIGPYWAAERRFIDEAYTSIPFPFKRIITPQFSMEETWDLHQLINYINTWSAVKTYEKTDGLNPLHLIESELTQAWGNPTSSKLIHWPIHLLAGRNEV
jgi:ubiquinone/menaquinone biosynthesis C-methylase UbiE